MLWHEAYPGACRPCRTMNGRTFEVVVPTAYYKDWVTQVWRGKSRIYSAKASGGPAGNWPSAGLQHPGCRGSWTSLTPKSKHYDPEFGNRMATLIDEAVKQIS